VQIEYCCGAGPPGGVYIACQQYVAVGLSDVNFDVPVESVVTVAIGAPACPFGSGVDIMIGTFGTGDPLTESVTSAEVIAGFGEYDGIGVGVVGVPKMDVGL
jgi:hypothetical protein